MNSLLEKVNWHKKNSLYSFLTETESFLSWIAAIKSYMYYAAAKDISLQQIQINISAVPFLKVEKCIRPIIENTDTLKALLNAPPNPPPEVRRGNLLLVLFLVVVIFVVFVFGIGFV